MVCKVYFRNQNSGNLLEEEKTTNNPEENGIKELYSGVRGLAVKILNRIERTDAYLDKLLDNEIKNHDLSGADKALLFEIVHGVVRWMGRLDWILSGFYKGQFSRALPVMKNALRVALYQIMFLDKVPEYAAVNEAVEFLKKLHGQKPADITNAVLRNIIKSKANLRYPNPDEDRIGFYATYYSHPSWLIKRWVKRFPNEELEQLLTANNERPSLTLRINYLRVSRNEFLGLLDSVNLRYTKGTFLPDFIKLQNLTNIANWQYFKEGYFTIQDESTGMSCKLLDVKPGMRILDLCAAPGGKTSFIADLINNNGKIVALDKFEVRVKMLDINFKRLGITCVESIAIDALEYEDSLLFDRVLADVPCSGLGTLSKKPDVKWKKQLLDIQQVTTLQYKLLCKAASLVKPGGVVVYSTCTIEPEENIEVIKKFLAENPDFHLVNAAGSLPAEVIDENGCVQTYPHRHKMDGAFAAKLVKTVNS